MRKLAGARCSGTYLYSKCLKPNKRNRLPIMQRVKERFSHDKTNFMDHNYLCYADYEQ